MCALLLQLLTHDSVYQPPSAPVHMYVHLYILVVYRLCNPIFTLRHLQFCVCSVGRWCSGRHCDLWRRCCRRSRLRNQPLRNRCSNIGRMHPRVEISRSSRRTCCWQMKYKPSSTQKLQLPWRAHALRLQSNQLQQSKLPLQARPTGLRH